MGAHINKDGQFQSDKYPTCPAGKVPLSVKDQTAQDLLWEYAQRRRSVDTEFSADLETALLSNGYEPGSKKQNIVDGMKDAIAFGRGENVGARVTIYPKDQMFYGFFEDGQTYPIYDPLEQYGPTLCPFCGKLLSRVDVRTHSLMYESPSYAKRSYFYRTHRTCAEKHDQTHTAMDGFILDMIARNGD